MPRPNRLPVSAMSRLAPGRAGLLRAWRAGRA